MCVKLLVSKLKAELAKGPSEGYEESIRKLKNSTVLNTLLIFGILIPF